MRWILFLLLSLSSFAADFDCAVIGTSPFSLFEALYQSHLGKRVLILEQSDICGGAWKGIYVCGIPNVDLGCHQIGSDANLKLFLEEYAGCKIISLDHPERPFEPGTSPNGWYFSRGCSELIDHLLELIRRTDIVLMTQTKVETAFVDKEKKLATLQTQGGSFTAEKLIVTPMSSLAFNTSTPPTYAKSKYYHLYLLVQDPTPPRFTYHHGSGVGASRLMNLTPFLSLEGTGRHLIVVQTRGEKQLDEGENYIEAMKKENLLGPSAYILRSEPYIYESGSLNQSQINQIGGGEIVEILQTGHFQTLAQSISKWKTALKTYKEALAK